MQRAHQCTLADRRRTTAGSQTRAQRSQNSTRRSFDLQNNLSITTTSYRQV
jgi:hypothetical protein